MFNVYSAYCLPVSRSKAKCVVMCTELNKLHAVFKKPL